MELELAYLFPEDPAQVESAMSCCQFELSSQRSASWTTASGSSHASHLDTATVMSSLAETSRGRSPGRNSTSFTESPVAKFQQLWSLLGA